jgi:hypothetical protein
MMMFTKQEIIWGNGLCIFGLRQVVLFNADDGLEEFLLKVPGLGETYQSQVFELGGVC